MNDTKHTPGPWFDRENLREPHLTVVREGGELLAVLMDSGEGYEVDEANALLIAAAPDMLAALMAVKEYGSHRETDDGVSTDYLVEAAIAKATQGGN